MGCFTLFALEKGSNSPGMRAFTGPVFSSVSLHLSLPPLMLPTPLFPSPLRPEQWGTAAPSHSVPRHLVFVNCFLYGVLCHNVVMSVLGNLFSCTTIPLSLAAFVFLCCHFLHFLLHLSFLHGNQILIYSSLTSPLFFCLSSLLSCLLISASVFPQGWHCIIRIVLIVVASTLQIGLYQCCIVRGVSAQQVSSAFCSLSQRSVVSYHKHSAFKLISTHILLTFSI